MLLRWIEYAANRHYIGCYIAAVALLLSHVFCFVIYPWLPASLHGSLDPDHHGQLGLGLWRNASVSYFPDNDPTVERGPVYPAFVALALASTNGWYPGCVQAAQCVLFALQCLMVFWMGKVLWGKRAAVVAGATCAAHPFLIWYLSRLRLEIPATFLFTAVAAASLYLWLRPSVGRALLLGMTLGMGALCKANMLPFVVLVPFVLKERDRRLQPRIAVLAMLTALTIIAPWTIRNWRLTGRFVPVHVLLGVNMHIGDVIATNYHRAPLSFDQLWGLGEQDALAFERGHVPNDISRAQRELIKDSLYMRSSLARYTEHPGFLARKMGLNALLFWFLGESSSKTAIIVMLNLPLLILFVAGLTRNLQHSSNRSIVDVHLMLVALLFASHVPVAACARYAVVVVPTMLVYAAGALKPLSVREPERGDQHLAAEQYTRR